MIFYLLSDLVSAYITSMGSQPHGLKAKSSSHWADWSAHIMRDCINQVQPEGLGRLHILGIAPLSAQIKQSDWLVSTSI